LGGIRNLQLANDPDIPTLVIRPQGKLAPPLLTSTIQPSNLTLLNANRQNLSKPTAEGAAAMPAVPSPARATRLGRSAFKTSSSLLTGRLNRQAKGRASLPPAPEAAPGSPDVAVSGFEQMGGGSATVTTPAADAAAAQEEAEAGQTPGWTQQQWDEYMQSGSTAPVSTSKPTLSKASGRKKPVRPVLKKQRMNTIVLD